MSSPPDGGGGGARRRRSPTSADAAFGVSEPLLGHAPALDSGEDAGPLPPPAPGVVAVVATALVDELRRLLAALRELLSRFAHFGATPQLSLPPAQSAAVAELAAAAAIAVDATLPEHAAALLALWESAFGSLPPPDAPGLKDPQWKEMGWQRVRPLLLRRALAAAQPPPCAPAAADAAAAAAADGGSPPPPSTLLKHPTHTATIGFRTIPPRTSAPRGCWDSKTCFASPPPGRAPSGRCSARPPARARPLSTPSPPRAST